MPSQLTHILAGEEALARCGDELAVRAVSSAPAFFRLGCQGPDIFYHNQRTRPSGIHFGTLLHKKNYGTMFAAACEAASAIRPGKPREATLAYLLGLSTHAATDRIMHPFIIHFSGRVVPGIPETRIFSGCHAFLERLIDTALLRRHRGIGPESFNIAASLDIATDRNPEFLEALVAIWDAGLRGAFPRATARDGLIADRVVNAFRDAAHFYEITNPHEAARKNPDIFRFADLDIADRIRIAALLYPLHLPEAIDFMNVERIAWTHPSGDGRSSEEDCYSLFAEAVTESALCMRACADYLSERIGMDELAAAMGDECLGSCSQNGAPSPGNATSPLPLAGELLLWSEELASRD